MSFATFATSRLHNRLRTAMTDDTVSASGPDGSHRRPGRGRRRIVMISRIRIEAQAPDPETCRRDIFAAIHQMIGHTVGDMSGSPPSVFYSSWVVEEVYERLDWNERVQPEAGELCAYKGRVVLGMPINYGSSLHGTEDGRSVYQSSDTGMIGGAKEQFPDAPDPELRHMA